MASTFERGYPKFLGIGAAYSGTTWLHANLRRHPRVWLPPVKEMHYFDLFREGSADYYCLPAWSHPEVSKEFLRRHRRVTWMRMLSFRSPPLWSLRFMYGKRDDAWYANLFRRGKIAGEITPTYLNVPKHVVEAVREFNPEMKIILMLRDPVSRAWSAIRRRKGMIVRKFKGLGRNELELKVLEMLNEPAFLNWNDYVGPIKIWREVFGEKQMFIGYLDDLKERPRDLLRWVLDFLELDSKGIELSNEVEEVVNKGPKMVLPEKYLPQLYRPYLEQLRELEKMLGGPTTKWRAKAEKLVGEGTAAPA
jgi:hypothetical protein